MLEKNDNPSHKARVFDQLGEEHPNSIPESGIPRLPVQHQDDEGHDTSDWLVARRSWYLRLVGGEIGKGFEGHLGPEEEVEGQGTTDWALMDIFVADGHSQLSTAFLVGLAFCYVQDESIAWGRFLVLQLMKQQVAEISTPLVLRAT